MRLAVIAAVVATSSSWMVAGSATSTRAHPSRALIGCRAVVRYADGQSALGSIYAAFIITVRAGHRCSLIGFPEIQLVDRRGQPLPTHPRHSGYQLAGISLRRVLLRHGRPGYFDLIYRTFDDRGHHCPPIASAIRVRLPGQPGWQTVRVDGRNPNLRVFDPCGGAFTVTPVATQS